MKVIAGDSPSSPLPFSSIDLNRHGYNNKREVTEQSGFKDATLMGNKSPLATRTLSSYDNVPYDNVPYVLHFLTFSFAFVLLIAASRGRLRLNANISFWGFFAEETNAASHNR